MLGIFPFARRGVNGEDSVEVLPGTEIMADVAGSHFVHAYNTSDSTVLIPQPTSDPQDPLVSIQYYQNIYPGQPS